MNNLTTSKINEELDIFENYMNDKFLNLFEAFIFLLNLNYNKKSNKNYDDKGLSNPIIIDKYVYKASGTRSYCLYVRLKEESDTNDTIKLELLDDTIKLNLYKCIYKYSPDGW
jgi:hypothetical protein